MVIVDRHGRPYDIKKPVLEEIGISGVRDRYSTYPSKGLTPESLASIFQEADNGDVMRQSELFEEMEEKDAHLGSVLQTRKLAAVGLEWEVTPASESTEDKDIASFITEVITWVENWDDALLDLLDAIGKGFAVAEIMWEISENKVWLKELRWRHQKKFTFLAPPDNGFWGFTDTPRLLTDAQPIYGLELPPNKFVVHKYRARSGNVARGGILRPCAYMYLFKNYSIKDWVIFAERFAMPMRIGKFNASTSDSDKKVLRNAVFNLGSDAAAVISDSTIIELLTAGGKSESSGSFEELIAFCDRSMSKSVLGHTGSSDSTPGKLGGEDEAKDVRRDILESDAKSLGKTIKMQIIRPLVEFNFGPGKNLPEFVLHYEQGEDLKAVAETYGILVSQTGFDGIPKSHIYKKFGIPVPENNEETVKPPQTGGGIPLNSFKYPLKFVSEGAGRAKAPVRHANASKGQLEAKKELDDTMRMAMKQSSEWVEAYLERIAPMFAGVQEVAASKVSAWLHSLDAPPSEAEFVSNIQGILGDAFERIDKKEIKLIVSEMYKWHKVSDLLAPGIESAFGGADVRTVEFLSKIDTFYLSKFIKNPESVSAMNDFLISRYHESGAGLFGNDPEVIREFKNLLSQNLTDLSEGQIQRIVDTAVQRNRNFAHISQMHEGGILEIEIYEPTRNCDFCKAMHGQIIVVGNAYAEMQNVTSMSPDEYESYLKKNPATLDNIESFVSAGRLAPYHPYCHGRIIIKRRA